MSKFRMTQDAYDLIIQYDDDVLLLDELLQAIYDQGLSDGGNVMNVDIEVFEDEITDDEEATFVPYVVTSNGEKV